jgi:hypothetical protein
MALPTPAHEKKREANQRGIRRHKEEKAEDDPKTKQRHSQRRLHGTHAHPFWADSGHLAPLPHAPLSWHFAHLVAWCGGLVTLPLLLGLNSAEIEGHNQHEERAQQWSIAHDRFHCHPPVRVRERRSAVRRLSFSMKTE